MSSLERSLFADPERLFEGFENLMPFRVQDILLVSSLYDSFILREDGRLNEILISQSLELHLQHTPEITHVSSGAEALELARTQPRYNLIVSNARVNDMDCQELAASVRESGLDIPVVVLAFDAQEAQALADRGPLEGIEQVFLWQGNPRLLLSIVKYVEDKRNVEHDSLKMGVPVVLLVEDEVRYYSALISEIYIALITQSRRVLSEGYNLAHKLVRMRARPKILLATQYEQAVAIVERYREVLFGVVSDVEFPRARHLDPAAGFELAHLIRRTIPDIPVVLQSSDAGFQARAHAEGFAFLRKSSDTLLADLRKLLTQEFAFGDFIFRLKNGAEVGRAADLDDMETQLRHIPAESLIFHGERNDISHWLIARTELALAEKLRPRRVVDFQDAEALRANCLEAIRDYRRQQKEVLVGDFQPEGFRSSSGFFLRFGVGSLGGKARGLAFVRHLLHKVRTASRWPGVRIAVPNTLVIATDLFEQFLTENNLEAFAIQCQDEEELLRRFLAAPLPRPLRAALADFLRTVRVPLAVRSSSLLEDSQYQPFTGVYDTFMLANSSRELNTRVEELNEAVKRVYASTYSRHARAYIRATPFRLEEEKMAVMIQELVGSPHGTRFYPDFSGVARSRNFYPIEPMQSGDGVAAVALGLGRTVVDGGKSLSFCPRYPRHMIQFSTVEDILRNSQTEFLALDLSAAAAGGEERGEHLREHRFPLRDAEADGTLHYVASTYSRDNDAIYDGLSRPGARVVTFAPILKYNIFPLPEILEYLQKLGADALGRPVEIEFAVRMGQNGAPAEFGFLQMRPLVCSREAEDQAVESVEAASILCRSANVLGNGRIEDIHDLVVVDYESFHRANSVAVAEIVGRFNAQLAAANTPYILIGVGRWGSKDPWLGIPVTWDQVSGARVIVEAGFRDFRVTPSQGSHFFQNLTAFRIAYFTINPDLGEGLVDWPWLAAQTALEQTGPVRHIRTERPFTVAISGARGVGVVLKPNGESAG
ncbi:MAG: PEP/pyruvate-binding domain-containing protein [Acidobacteriota bacterium]|nr:PEP/pyruvate-binding domain-containing protein [Acidobacteriota bacterium]